MSTVGIQKGSSISARLRLHPVTENVYADFKQRFGEGAVVIQSEEHFIKVYDIFDGIHRYHALLTLVAENKLEQKRPYHVSVYNSSLHDVAAELVGILNNEIQTVARAASYPDTLFYILKNVRRNRTEEAQQALLPIAAKGTNSKKAVKQKKKEKAKIFTDNLHSQFLLTATATLDAPDLLKFTKYWTKAYVVGKVLLTEWMEGTPMVVLLALNNIIWSNVVDVYKTKFAGSVPMSTLNLIVVDDTFPCKPKESELVNARANSLVSSLGLLLGHNPQRAEYSTVADVSPPDRYVVNMRYLVLHLSYVSMKLFSEGEKVSLDEKIEFLKNQQIALFVPQQNGDMKCDLVERCLGQLLSDFDVLGKLFLDSLCHPHSQLGLPSWTELAGIVESLTNVDDVAEPGRDYLKNPGLRKLSAATAPGSVEQSGWKEISQRYRLLVLMLMVT